MRLLEGILIRNTIGADSGRIDRFPLASAAILISLFCGRMSGLPNMDSPIIITNTPIINPITTAKELQKHLVADMKIDSLVKFIDPLISKIEMLSL